jgi:hypothetical protein
MDILVSMNQAIGERYKAAKGNPLSCAGCNAWDRAWCFCVELRENGLCQKRIFADLVRAQVAVRE